MKKLMMGLSAVMLGMVSSVSAATKVSVSVADPRYGESFSLTANGENLAVDAVKEFDAGTKVTVTATSQTHYLRFGSDPIENVGTTATTTFTADGTGEVKLSLWCHPGWTYSETDGSGTISDGVWKLNVTKTGESIGIGTSGNNSALTGVGEGILDLSAPVEDENGTPLNITGFNSDCFSANADKPDLPVSMLVFPLSTVSIGSRAILNYTAGENSPLTNVVMVVPHCTSIGEMLFFTGGNNCGHQKLATLKVVAPLLKSIPANAFIGDWASCYTHGCVYKDTDLGTWDLSGVETIGEAGLKYINARGILKLPKLFTVGKGGFESAVNMDGLEIGTAYAKDDDKALALGDQALRCLKHLKTLTFGPYESYTFNGVTAGKLTESLSVDLSSDGCLDITFLGNPPTQGVLDEFLNPMTIQKKATISVVSDCETKWETLIDNMQTTEEQYLPTLRKSSDLLGVYRAENRKAWVVRKSVKISVSLADPRYGEDFDVQVNGQSVSFGAVAECSIGDQVTVTAMSTETDGRTRYLRFGSDPIENVGSTASKTFTIENSDDINLQLWCHTGWTYSDETKTISDGVWKLNVTKSSNNITVGTNGYNSAFTDEGEGILDLSTPVTDGTGNPLSITTFANNCFAIHGTDTTLQKHPLTMMIFPTTTTSSGSWLFIDNLTVANLTNVVMVLPHCTSLGSALFKGNQNLETLKVVAPQVETLNGSEHQGVFQSDWSTWNATKVYDKSDAGTWDISSVATVNRDAFKYTNLRGVLSLPKLLTGAYGAFETASGLDGLVFGTAYVKKDNQTLTLGEQALRNLYRLKTLTFGPYASYSFETNVANAALASKVDKLEIVFEGVPPSQKALDSLLLTINGNTGAKKVVIYGSRNLQWDKMADATLTPDEEAAKAVLEATLSEDEYVMGVYVTAEVKADDGTVTKQAERKAWIVHRASEFDPKGTILIVR